MARNDFNKKSPLLNGRISESFQLFMVVFLLVALIMKMMRAAVIAELPLLPLRFSLALG